MRSHSGGSLSATTQVKVSSPKITRNAQGQGFHFLETNIVTVEKGEKVTACWGLSPWRANEMYLMELGRTKSCQNKRSFQGVEEMTREYGGLVFGLTHSRGVGRVMPAESKKQGTLEGVSSKMQREESRHAVH